MASSARCDQTWPPPVRVKPSKYSLSSWIPNMGSPFQKCVKPFKVLRPAAFKCVRVPQVPRVTLGDSHIFTEGEIASSLAFEPESAYRVADADRLLRLLQPALSVCHP